MGGRLRYKWDGPNEMVRAYEMKLNQIIGRANIGWCEAFAGAWDLAGVQYYGLLLDY